jgi:hypothetical protein
MARGDGHTPARAARAETEGSMTLMAVDFPKFFATAVELYDLWPSFFHWAAGLIIPIIGGLVFAGWWMRGFKADANEARLNGRAEANEAALNGKIGILEQRLAFAAEQQTAAERVAEGFRNELDELKEKMAHDARPEDIRQTVTNLEVQLGKLLAANNATTTTLTSPGLPAHLTQFTDSRWLEKPKATSETERKK